jgi:formylglycine-generating enzyme required for sulfatase activity
VNIPRLLRVPEPISLSTKPTAIFLDKRRRLAEDLGSGLVVLGKHCSSRTGDSPMRARLCVPLCLLPLLAGAAPDVAQEKKAGLEVPLKSGDKLVLEFARIPKGKFLMGSPKDEKDRSGDEDEHEVEIKRDYFLGKTTITRGQFRAFVEDDGYKTEAEQDGKGGYGWTGTNWEQKPEFTWKNPGFAQTDDHPVVIVSYYDANAFCAWVKRKTGKEVCLPREAEWERACRGGQRKGRYFFGDNEEDLAQYANVADASFRKETKQDYGIKADDHYAFTAPVGKFQANPYGLYDMHGNVWQWCSDRYDEKYYANSDKEDPK